MELHSNLDFVDFLTDWQHFSTSEEENLISDYMYISLLTQSLITCLSFLSCRL